MGRISFGIGGLASDTIGALPFAIRSTDSTQAIFTSTALRDTYYTTNPGDIAAGTDLARRRAVVGIGPTDGNPVGVTAAFIRNEANDGWEAIATNFEGAQGPTGPAGPPSINFGNLAADTIVRTNATNDGLATSSITEDSGQLSATKMLAVPDAEGIMFGGVQVINGGFNIAAATLDGRNFFPVASELTTPGSQRPSWVKLAAQSVTPSPANTDETFTGVNVQFRIINANTGLAEQYTFNAAAVASDCNLIIRFTSHTGPEVFNYKRANGGTGFDLVVGENDITIPGIGLFFRANVELFATLEPGSGNISLRGQTIDVGGMNETFPYAEVLGRLATDHNILTEDAGEFATVTEKTTPVNTDTLLIEDNADSGNKKRIQVGNLPGSTVAPVPSLHNFSIDIASRVDVGTDLNVLHTITFDVTNHTQITGLTLIVTTGTDQVLTTPVIDGVQSQTVTLAGISTAAAGSVTFQLSGTHAGGNALSNIVTVTIADLAGHEQAYYGVRQTNDFAAVDVSTLTAADVSNSGTVYNIQQQAQNNYYLGILSPSDRDPVEIFNTASNQFAYKPSDPSVTPSFTLEENVRTISSVSYNLLTIQNLSGFTATFNYRVTTE